MKVADVMHKQVDYVFSDVPIIGVARLIFGRGINGVPICKGKKVVGFVTERDILEKFYPSLQEFAEDPFREGDFEAMEKKVDEILNCPVSKIMSKNPTVVEPETPILRAQSLMFVNHVGRLPVVDKEGNLIGIITNGDVFRSVVGQRLPTEGEEQFHDWLSRRYDLIIDWKERLAKEIPDLVRLFKKEKITRILDLGCGTGMHAIELAKQGFHVVGLDRSVRMIAVAGEKKSKLAKAVQQRVQFIRHEYKDLPTILSEPFDSVMIMGAGLAHTAVPSEVLKEVANVFTDRALIVIQLPNFAKILTTRRRFYDFSIRTSPYPEEREQAFLRFYDPKENGHLTQNVSVFGRGTKRWEFRGMHSMSIMPLDKEKITSLLRGVKFTKLTFYGGEKGFFYDYLFSKPFSKIQSDVMVVVGKRT